VTDGKLGVVVILGEEWGVYVICLFFIKLYKDKSTQGEHIEEFKRN
jgi:hypothetical protein